MGNILISEDVLYEYYIARCMPMHEIADKLGVAIGSVYNYLHKYNIQPRTMKESYEILKNNGWDHSDETKEKFSKIHKGKKISEETKKKISEGHIKGGIGHKKKRQDGYIAIYFPDHPMSNKDGYIMEHVLVMECNIGRHLNEDEVVHHINEVRDDNRICNLKLMTKSEHMSYHSSERHKKKEK